MKPVGEKYKVYKVGEKVKIEVTRQETNFDKACDAAYGWAMMLFGCDTSGHLLNVEGDDRSAQCVIVQFKKYQHIGSMVGHTYVYTFEAWVH